MLTDESRKRAIEARRLAVAQAAVDFKQDWLDSGHWDELARMHGIRLPTWASRPTARKLLKWHRSLDKEPFLDVYGASPGHLIAMNPRVPLRAFVGQMLERVKT